MIRQYIELGRYRWRIKVFYAVDCYYTDEIIDELKGIGCHGEELRLSYKNLKSCKLDKGLTFSDYYTRRSVMVIGMTSSPAEFQDSLDHEKGHLCRHIEEAFGIDPYGEEAQYLAGDVGKKLFPVAKRFLCEC